MYVVIGNNNSSMASANSLRTHSQKTLPEGLVVVPTGATDLTTTDTVLFQIHFSNTTSGAVTVLVKDKQSTPRYAIPTTSIPANTAVLVVWPEGLKMTSGVTWQAGGAGLDAEVFGFSI